MGGIPANASTVGRIFRAFSQIKVWQSVNTTKTDVPLCAMVAKATRASFNILLGLGAAGRKID